METDPTFHSYLLSPSISIPVPTDIRGHTTHGHKPRFFPLSLALVCSCSPGGPGDLRHHPARAEELAGAVHTQAPVPVIKAHVVADPPETFGAPTETRPPTGRRPTASAGPTRWEVSISEGWERTHRIRAPVRVPDWRGVRR